MTLEKTLYNLRITKESFFNCKKDDFITMDLYKHNISVYFHTFSKKLIKTKINKKNIIYTHKFHVLGDNMEHGGYTLC